MPAETAPRVRLPLRLLAAVFLPVAALYGYLLRGAEGFRFAHPFALALGPLAVGLILWTTYVRRADRVATFRHSRASELGAHRPSLVARLRDLPVVLRLLGVTLLAVALARPQTSRASDDMELEGIDIVIALDVSGSMQETDLVPNRLDAAKMVIERFVRRRPNDRLALVVFGKDAYTHVPLTLDHGTYLRMLGELQVGIIDGRGTAIGNGIGVSLNRLRRSDAKSKVIIVLTDGDNNAGNISPVQAARFAQTLGVKIYTILAGDNGDSAATAQNTLPGQHQRQPVNPKLLEEIASMTGGAPYLATDTQSLAKNFQSILEDLEKSRLHDRAVLYGELFPKFAWGVFAVLLLEVALRLGRWRRLP
ncbi:MAG TPA: VWA domain-containing protein [Polyangia bacterium]|nr:VWA domain-containing protein [Polyangia bacterium]